MTDEIPYNESAQLGQAINIAIQILISEKEELTAKNIIDMTFERTLPMILSIREQYSSRKKNYEDKLHEESLKQEKDKLEQEFKNAL